MRAYSVTSEKLQNFSTLVWVTTDVAVASNHQDKCLYEIVLPPSLRGIRASKITQPFESSIISIAALPGGCGAGPSSSATGPTSQPNQKSPFQLSRSSGQGGDFGQTVIAVGTAGGIVHFLYVDVVSLGGQGQRVVVRRTKDFNLRECVGGAEEVLPVTAIHAAAPRGSQMLVGTETGHLLLFSMTGGQFAFKQMLRADLGAAVHAIHGINRSHFAFSAGNRLEVVQYTRPAAAEAVIRVPEAAITEITSIGNVLALVCETDGVVFYDLVQNVQISHFPAPAGDSVQSITVSASTGDFLASTAAGSLLLFNKSGILRDAMSTLEALSQDGTNGVAGGVYNVKYAPYGSIFLAICQAGLVYGASLFQRLSVSGVVFEPTSELKVKVTDNNLQVNDIFISPEPILNIFYDSNAFIGITATSVIVWKPPHGKELQELRQAGGGRNQWILEPQRTQTFTEAAGQGFDTAGASNEQRSQNVQMVGGVAFGSFNFQQTEEEAAKAAIQEQSSQVTKSALFLRHSVIFAKASSRFLLLQDISGEAQICQLNGLGLIVTLYTGQAQPENFCLTDEILIITEGNQFKIVETASGNYVCRSLAHQRRISSVSVGQIRQNQAQSSTAPQIQIGGLFGDLVGGNQQNQTQIQQASDAGAIIVLLDASGAVFVGRLQNAAFYQKVSQTSAAGFNQLKLSSTALDVAFPAGSEILVILARDAAGYAAPSAFIGGDSPDLQSRLRLLAFGRPADHVASLPAPLFVGGVALSVSTLLKTAAGIGFDEAGGSSSRQIQQFKLLQRQTAFQLERVALGQRGPLGASDVLSCASATVKILSGISHCVLALPEFPFVLESSVQAPEVGGRICRYVQQPSLWALQCSYCKARRDGEGLKLALAAVGQVPKALYEADSEPVGVLIEQGKVGKAILQLCDLWDFDGARAVVARDRRFGPLMIYLRRQRHAELGGLADEKNEPWASLAREFGDKATESCMQMVE